MLCPCCGAFFCLDEWPHGPEGEHARKQYCSAGCKARAKKKRKPPKPNVCPTPDKIVYDDITEARRGAADVLERHGQLLRPYRCREHWHLTSQRVWRT